MQHGQSAATHRSYPKVNAIGACHQREEPMNRIAIIAVAAAASFTAAVPAAANDTSVEVLYADLDTSSQAGVNALGKRVNAAVENACGRPDNRVIKATLAWKECRTAAREQVTEQLTRQGVPITVLG
jgi:UrcA family protein